MTQSDTLEQLETHNTTIKKIERLLVGTGAEKFKAFERSIAHFCPFEAIGMVRQEIRHAHFLSFILDPNRAHPFQDTILKAFLQEVSAQAHDEACDLNALDIHCSDFSNAVVYRERANIDLIIEIPKSSRPSNEKGLVVTVELKILASESNHQLKKYQNLIAEEYPSEQWDKVFVFLTLDGSSPSEFNRGTWIPVGILDLINRFDEEVELHMLTGEAVDLYKKYSSMLRRNLVHDEKLALLAKNIWAKHREALEALYKYWPNLQAEILDWLNTNHEEVTSTIESTCGVRLIPDTSTARILRYSISSWQDLPKFRGQTDEWVSTGSLVVLELSDWGDGRLRFSFVMGPGDADVRENLYEEVLKYVDGGEIKIGRKTSKIGTYKHLSARDVQTARDYEKASDGGMDAEELGRRAVKKMAEFLKTHMPIYDNIVREALKAYQEPLTP